MDALKNKQYHQYDYTSRYTDVPYYYNIKDKRQIYGLTSNLNKNTPWVAHQVVETDTLDYLALKYYNNPTFWWIIAYFNDIQDAFIKLSTHYTMLKIPSISSIEFGNELK
jgi:hypothetical protein